MHGIFKFLEDFCSLMQGCSTYLSSGMILRDLEKANSQRCISRKRNSCLPRCIPDGASCFGEILILMYRLIFNNVCRSLSVAPNQIYKAVYSGSLKMDFEFSFSEARDWLDTWPLTLLGVSILIPAGDHSKVGYVCELGLPCSDFRQRRCTRQSSVEPYSVLHLRPVSIK